jgi:hypothetical protein
MFSRNLWMELRLIIFFLLILISATKNIFSLSHTHSVLKVFFSFSWWVVLSWADFIYIIFFFELRSLLVNRSVFILYILYSNDISWSPPMLVVSHTLSHSLTHSLTLLLYKLLLFRSICVDHKKKVINLIGGEREQVNKKIKISLWK